MRLSRGSRRSTMPDGTSHWLDGGRLPREPGGAAARPRRPGRRRSRLHGQELVAAEDAVTIDVETVEERLAVAEFLAGEDAVTVGVPAVEHAGQPGAVAVLRVADVPVAVGVQDVEG